MSLIQTFAPQADESAMGYYRRLAAENAMSGWRELARLAEVAVTKDGLFARPEHVAACLGLDVAWAKQATAQDDKARSWRSLRRGRPDAVCPHCLHGSAHIRLSWEHAYMVACPVHRVQLCDSCSACGERLASRRERIEYCDCGHDLRCMQSPEATTAQLWLANLIASNGAHSGPSKPAVEGVSVDVVTMLVRALCLYSDPGTLPRRENTAPPTTLRESVEFLRPLESLLAHWPANFEAHVSARIAAGPPQARTLNALLGKWYHHMRGLAGCEPLLPFLEAIVRVATKEFDGLLGLDAAAEVSHKHATHVLLMEAAKRIGVHRDVLGGHVKAGTVAHRARLFGTRGQAFEIPVTEVDAIVAARQQWVDESSACKTLGVPLSVLQRMAEVNLLVVETDWRRDLRKGGPVERTSIERLIQRLRVQPEMPHPPEGRRMLLREFTSRRMGDKKALGAALCAVVAGDIRPVHRGATVGDTEYLVADVSKYVATPALEAGLSIQALAKITGWKWETISHWIESGLLQANELQLRGQPCRVVMPTQLLAFCRTYVPLADLAKEIGTKSSALAERTNGIEVLGAKPLPNGLRRGGLVRIGDLARAALTSTSHDPQLRDASVRFEKANAMPFPDHATRESVVLKEELF